MKAKLLSPKHHIVHDDLLLLMNSIQDYAIIRLDTEGNIISWNKGAEQIKGYTAQEVTGRSFSLFYAPEAIAAGLPKANLKLATVNGSYAETGLRIRKDGSAFWGDMVLTALYADDGSLRGFVKITRDITGQKQRDEELERLNRQASEIITEELNRTLKENTDYKHALDESAIVAITNQKGIITHVNDNFCKILYIMEMLTTLFRAKLTTGLADFWVAANAIKACTKIVI